MATGRPVDRPCDRAIYEQDGGGRMTTRKDLADDMTGIETILLDLDDVTPSGLTDKQVIKAITRCLWHILEYLIRRDK